MKKYDYNIDVSVTGTVSADTVEQMVKDIVENETGRKISSMIMRVRSKTDGQVITSVFDGVTITFEGEKKTADVNLPSSLPFKQDKY
jgi:hypothetical protein